MKRAQPEFKLACTVAGYLAAAAPDLMVTHFPAGEARTAITGARLQRMGLKPGWPDYIAVLPGGRMLGLELKADKGRLSKAQEGVQEAFATLGAAYHVIRSLDDLRAVLALHGVLVREAGH